MPTLTDNEFLLRWSGFELDEIPKSARKRLKQLLSAQNLTTLDGGRTSCQHWIIRWRLGDFTFTDGARGFAVQNHRLVPPPCEKCDVCQSRIRGDNR